MQFLKPYVLAAVFTGLPGACSEPGIPPEIVSSVPYEADRGDLLLQCGTFIDDQSEA